MPLEHSKSKAAFKRNIEAEMNAGKPQKQAVAIAYSVKRHVTGDDRQERNIERRAHERFKYGR